MKHVMAILFTVAISGCDILGTDCKDYAAPGIEVQLLDAPSGRVIEGREAVVRVISGSYTDSMRISSGQSMPGGLVRLAIERPGTYRVEAVVSGYEMWSQDNVSVARTSDGCHVKTVLVRAELEPQS